MSQGGAAKVQEVSTGAAVIRGGLRKELIPGPLTRQPRTPKDIHARTKLRLRDRDTEERLTYGSNGGNGSGNVSWTGAHPRIDPGGEDAWTSGTITPMPPPVEARALTT